MSRTGRMSETASAAKPTAVANIEAVQGRNLFAMRARVMFERMSANRPARCTANGCKRAWRWS